MRDERDATAQVRAWLAGTLETAPLPDQLLPDVLRRVSVTPQASVTTGGATVLGPHRWPALPLVARTALGVAGLVSAMALGFVLRDGLQESIMVVGSQRPSPTGPQILVVDRLASDSYRTITDAVADARDGDTILIRPGEYEERVAISRDIVVAGDGPLGSVVVRAAAGATGTPEANALPAAFVLSDTEATIRDLTVTGPEVASAIAVHGGAPLLTGLAIDLDGDQVGAVPGAPHENLVIDGASQATVRASTFDGFVSIEDSSTASFTDNRITGGCVYVVGPGADAYVHGNVFRGSGCPTFAIGVKAGARPTVEQNTIDGGSLYGVEVMGDGSGPIVRGNSIRGLPIGIWVQSGGEPVITDNLVESNEIGLAVSWTKAIVRGNRFHDNDVGVVASGAVDADVDGNVFEGNGVGFRSEQATERIALTGGAWCGNRQDIEVVSGQPPAVVEPLPCPPGSTPVAGAP